jgi:hypothetical protein
VKERYVEIGRTRQHGGWRQAARSGGCSGCRQREDKRGEKELGGGFRFCAGDYVVEGCPR